MRFAYLTLVSFAVFTGCGPEVTETTGPSSSSSSSSSSNSSGMGGSGNSSGTGGVGGLGGEGGSGGTTAAPAPECQDDADCTLVNDCCSCEGVSKNETVPECSLMNCFVSTCESMSLSQPMAMCRAGRCVVNADCNQAHALCNSIPPVCSPGKTPIVVNGCWGGCIDPIECSEVGDCTQCTADQACIENVAFTVERHCVDIPAACNGQVECSCLGATTCIKPYGLCIDPSAPTLRCECPNC
jgi:hypothetical protein